MRQIADRWQLKPQLRRPYLQSKSSHAGRRLPFVEASTAKGRIYLYYRRDGRRQSLPGPEGSTAFLAAYREVHDQFENPVSPWAVHTVGRAITEYLASADYRQLADSSRTEYRRVLDGFREGAGHLGLAQLDAAWIHALRTRYAEADRPHQWLSLRNRMIMVEAHYRTAHPNAGIGRPWAESKRLRIEESDQNQPWPEHFLLAALREATPEFRAFLVVCLLTSQRSGDVCAFGPEHYDRSSRTLRFLQSKTGTPVTLHVPDALAATFDAMAGRLPDRLLVTPRGSAWNTTNARETMQSLCVRLGMGRYVVHGLRATGPTVLAEQGFELRAIRALTGHTSDAQAEIYLRRVNKLGLARPAQEAVADRFSDLVGGMIEGANTRSFSGVTGRAARKAGVAGASRRLRKAPDGSAKRLPNAKPAPGKPEITQ